MERVRTSVISTANIIDPPVVQDVACVEGCPSLPEMQKYIAENGYDGQPAESPPPPSEQLVSAG